MSLNLKRYAPTFSLLIGGNPQQDLRKSIISIEVDDSIETASTFTFSINEGFDKKTQNFTWLDSKLLDPESGDDVKIYMGYAGEASKSDELLITGRITALNPSFPSSGTPSLSVQGYDHAFILQKSIPVENIPFAKMGYPDAVKKIAGKNNLGETKIDADTIKPCETMMQKAGESDYDFIKGLADRIGYEFFVRNKEIYFRKPLDNTDEVISLSWGREIISFSPRMSTAKVVSKFTVRGHNQKDPSKPIVGVATLSDLGFKESGARSGVEAESAGSDKSEKTVTDTPVCSEEDAKNLARALLMRANNSLIEGTCECIGIPGVRAGTNIKIEGIGKRFSGKYYIKSIKHSIGDGGYTMSLNVRRGGSGII